MPNSDISDAPKPAVPPTGIPAASRRRADIQGLRAIAVLMVVFFHAGLPLSGGFIGVDVFLVISGFVITSMLLPRLETSGHLNFRDFYTRRIRRLLPALSVLIVIIAASSVFLLSPLGPQESTAKTGIAASIFSANTYLIRAGNGGYFALSADTNALLHTWSLSAEEQFYLFFPAFLVACWLLLGKRHTERRHERHRLVLPVLIVTVASFFLSLLLSRSAPGSTGALAAFFSSPTRVWEFGAGATLAIAAPLMPRLGRTTGSAFGVVGLIILLVTARTLTGSEPFPGLVALLPVTGACLLLMGGLGANNPVKTALGAGPLVWLGDLSYSWYLWHWPLIVFAGALWPTSSVAPPAAALIALLAAWISYHVIEDPIRFNERFSGRRVVLLFVACIILPIIASMGLLLTNRIITRSSVVERYAEALRPHLDNINGCDRGQPIGDGLPSECTQTVANPLGTVVLVGDSNAGQLTEGAAEAANRAGYDFTVSTLPSCPFANVELMSSPAQDEQCRHYVTTMTESLKVIDPALVIIASTASQNINSDLAFMDPATGSPTTTPAKKAQLWQAGLSSLLDDLGRDGIHTVVVHTLPHLDNVEPRTCPAIRIFFNQASCAAGVDRHSIETQQRLAREAEVRAIASTPTASGVDFTEDLCSAVICRPCNQSGVIARSARLVHHCPSGGS